MRVRPIVVTAVIAVTAVLLASCALGDPDGGAAGEPRTFVTSTGTVPHLNPQVIASPSVDIVTSPMLEPLVRLDDTFQVHPWLARDWEVSEDGRTVTLQLQEGVSWHDGEPFTAEDVRFNVEEVMRYQAYGAQLVEHVESVATPDDSTVVITLDEPFGPIMEVLTLQQILPRHVFEGTDILDNPANMAPVGTGAFVFENFDEGREISMTANPDYWRGDVEVDRLIFVSMTDTNAATLALLAGDTQIGGAGQGMLDQIRAAEHLELTQRGQLPRQFVFTMNTDVPELADPEVRKLVYRSINRAQVADVALPEVSTEATAMFPEEMEWIDPGVDYREEFSHDPDEVNAALDAAGHPRGPDGNRFTLRLHLMSVTAEARAVGAVIQSSMAEVGIGVDLRGEDTSVFQENVYHRRDFDMAIVEATLGVDPSVGITRWYHCVPEPVDAENPSGVCDQEIQQAVDNALRSSDRADRARHLRAVQDRATEIMIAAPLVYTRPFGVYNTEVWDGLGNPDGLLSNDWTTITPK
ncbi:ABC transporter substrate-binding protein [Pseudonocardia sp. NPDC046786]|uniref:ABC transporter substrate-binding protein n=1 Tax=Pseudonocardia sp. NPDC046786 TaxID=3155471 RepID=UPI0033D37135